MDAQYDDLFLYTPGFLQAELAEGKAIGTAALSDLVLAQDRQQIKDADPVAFAAERKKGLTVGKRKLGEVQARTKNRLLNTILQWQAGEFTERALRKEAGKAMKTAWRDVFLAGLRAGGTKGQGAGRGKTLIRLSPGDDKWLKGAMQHEMRFLNKFITAVVEDTYVMPLDRRTQMYVNALESFYNSARVISLPSNTLIEWRGPNDKRTCPSCAYMFANTPFPKNLLPTTPRAGLTICLTNCRDKLVLKRVDPSEAAVKIKQSKYTRGSHIKNLRRIKRLGRL